MKLLKVSLLLAGAGASWFGLRSDGAAASLPNCSAGACSVAIECIDPETCLVTCHDENGAVLCQEEIPCDEQPCPAACSTSCGPDSSAAPAPVLVSAPAPDDDC